jgi:hypothetical protein
MRGAMSRFAAARPTPDNAGLGTAAARWRQPA